MHHSGSGRLARPSPWGTCTSYSLPAFLAHSPVGSNASVESGLGMSASPPTPDVWLRRSEPTLRADSVEQVRRQSSRIERDRRRRRVTAAKPADENPLKERPGFLARSSQDRYLLLVRSWRPEQSDCLIGYTITSSAASRRISSWPVGEIDGAWSGPLSSSFCAVHSLASSRVSRN